MPKKKDDQTNWKLKPGPFGADGCRWELIMPMLQEMLVESEADAPESEFFKGCWSGVKDIRTGINPETGREFISWVHHGNALFGGAFEWQKVAYKTVCPNCGHDAANLCSTDSLIQRCCKNCRLGHERAMARNAAKRRRRAKGEVTTPMMKACETCGEMFFVERSTARFCSTKCRVAAHRSKASAPR